MSAASKFMELAGKQAAGESIGHEVDGKSIGLDVISTDGTEAGQETVDANDSTSNEIELPGQNEESSENGDTPEDSQKTAKAKAASKSEIPNKEVVVITDDKGRRKVEVDFSNKEQLTKYVQMAFGARKWQAERDQALQARKQVEAEHGDLKKNWASLESAWSEKGEEGLFDLLRGKPGAYQEMISKQIERRDFLKHATPEEKEALQARENAEAHKRELEKIRKENEDFRKQMSEEREKADLRSMESQVHPVFDKYRFAGRLDDAQDEQIFDTMLWNTAIDRLTDYENQGHQISRELIDREFRSVSATLNKRIGAQAQNQVKKVIDQKKREATENVQAKVMSGYKTPNGTAKEARDMLSNGNLQGIFKQWGKYGQLFGSKK